MIIAVIVFGVVAALIDLKFNRGRLARRPLWQVGCVFFCAIMALHMLTGA
jgi:hypothetical protein